MNRLRLRAKLGLIVGILVLCVLVVAFVGYFNLAVVREQTANLVEVTAKKAALAADLRSHLQRARRMELRTVLTPDDDTSAKYTEATREYTGQVESTYAALAALVDPNPSAEERSLLDSFHRAWKAYHELQENTLKLSLDNTNVKAHQLTVAELGPRIDEIDEACTAWLRQLNKVRDTASAGSEVRPPDGDAVRQAVQRLQVLTLDVHRLLNQHVHDTTDAALDRMDERLAERLAEIQTRLAELTAEGNPQDLPRLDGLTAAWRAAMPLVAQLQKLVRGNTNARSMELAESANDEIDTCMTALTELSGRLAEQMQETLATTARRSRLAQRLMVGVPLVCVAVGLVLAWVVQRSIVDSMAAGVKFSQALAAGDLTQRLHLAQQDEVGMLGRAMDHVAAAFGKVVGQIRTIAASIGSSAAELSSVSHQVLSQSQQITAQAGQVASSTEQMASNVTTMAAATEEMSMNVASISSASEEISVNVGTISAAAESTARNVTTVSAELQEATRTFEVVAHEAQDGARVAGEALQMADGASHTMQQLERSASDIGKVTDTIKMIALQTNLLALNATIEATSAGEAGKGFAVVAHEIKELANQSAQAAEDIARKIEDVQGSTQKAVQAIREVQQIIHALDASSLRIAESITQRSVSARTSAANLAEASQGVEHIARSIAEVAKGANDMSRSAGEAATAANDMSRNAGEAAKAVSDISANIHGVSQATRDNTASAQLVNAAAEQLATIAGQLQQLVDQFRIHD